MKVCNIISSGIEERITNNSLTGCCFAVNLHRGQTFNPIGWYYKEYVIILTFQNLDIQHLVKCCVRVCR